MTYNEVQSIMVLGDSVSKGVVYSAEKERYIFSKEGFIKRLAQKLRPEVFDFSKYGSTTEYGKKLIDEKFHELAPDLVLIEYGSNDCDFNWDDVAADPLKDHQPKLPLGKYVENVLGMISTVRQNGKIPILTNLHPLSSHNYFNWFTRNDPDRQAQTLVWLKDIGHIYWWQEMYSYAVEKAARAMDVFVVNIRNLFLRQKDYKQYLCEDGIHPNEEGHSLMESFIMDTISHRAPGLL